MERTLLPKENSASNIEYRAFLYDDQAQVVIEESNLTLPAWVVEHTLTMLGQQKLKSKQDIEVQLEKKLQEIESTLQGLQQQLSTGHPIMPARKGCVN